MNFPENGMKQILERRATNEILSRKWKTCVSYVDLNSKQPNGISQSKVKCSECGDVEAESFERIMR